MRTLIVERFDRIWTRDKRLLRLPQEDFCQAPSIPPVIKYEADGGPGIIKILELLKGSDTPEVDREIFMKLQVTFWLLAATDGHAKNFSIFLSPGGRFHLTPLYDVLSAQLSFDLGQIQKKRMKLAMAIRDNRHYQVHTVMPWQFLQTAKQAGLSSQTVKKLVRDLIERVPIVLLQFLKNFLQSFRKRFLHQLLEEFDID